MADDMICSAECGEMETRLHYTCRKFPALSKFYQQHRTMFNQVHVKLCTAQIVYHAMTSILGALRDGDEPVLMITCDSDIDRAVCDA